MDFGCLWLTMKNEEFGRKRMQEQGTRGKEEFGMMKEG